MSITARHTDFDVVWLGARVLLLEGRNPWQLIGPGREVDWLWPLIYPGTALVAVAPFAVLPLEWARSLFVGASATALAWAVTRDGWWRLTLFVSVPVLHAMVSAQWSLLVAAAFLLPALGGVAAIKPTVGLATVASAPHERWQWVALASGVALLAVSLAVAPTWVLDWRREVAGAQHLSPPVAHWRVGGPLVLLALLRWRRPEARWLVALACVPQSTVPYEAVYFMLFPCTRVGLLALTVLSYGAGALHYWIVGVATSTVDLQYRAGDALVALFYLPALWMVLRRENRGETPRWLDAVAAVVWRAFGRRVNAAASGGPGG
ncbi:hypothetical protein [Roseisolibacter sp. H3M3-2]|uniref:hypothetical protein n=1 Tax=Roseisolibacter sp. H3M3-2 TaxID=3031323 RepID=UPI0023DA2476|nr:hypothetical protein [Roseisolibacter sp. H3M3-2]MDF1501887.1 hypothetical protein [Roseisolibacter sp. H3M3-2]